jgi:hypothetical protein
VFVAKPVLQCESGPHFGCRGFDDVVGNPHHAPNFAGAIATELSHDVLKVNPLSRSYCSGSALSFYCLAHHLTVDGDKRHLMIAALRYYDTFAKIDGTWLFAERLLYVDWIEERVLS